MTIDQNRTLGDIVLNFPDTVKVFNAYKMDYCCNGHETLETALNKLTTNIDEVIDALETSIEYQHAEAVTDWQSQSMSALIDHILTTHHTFMRETLDELNFLVFKILKVHFRGHSEQLLQVHHLFGTLKTELEAHLVKEEENLFPLIKRYEARKDVVTKQAILKFINDTEDEHDGAGDLFKQLEVVTNDFTPPNGVCVTYKRTFALLDALQKDTFNHIHLENSVLFTMID